MLRQLFSPGIELHFLYRGLPLHRLKRMVEKPQKVIWGV